MSQGFRIQGRDVNELCLIVLLEAELVSPLSETPSADIESVLADHTAGSLANSAATFKCAFRVLAGVLRNKGNWHWRERTATTAETAIDRRITFSVPTDPIPMNFLKVIRLYFWMSDLQQIRLNLAKIQELDQQLEKLHQEESTQRVDQGNQIVDHATIELQLLLEEMEQQQDISKRLLEENQDLQRRLQADKLRFEKAKDEVAALALTQRETLEKQRKAMEAEQNREDVNSQKEERRLQQSVELLTDKNTKLTEQKKILLAKLDQLKSAISSPMAGKKTAGPK
jgi:hypothetical protein